METVRGQVRFLHWLGSNEVGDWLLMGMATAVLVLWMEVAR